MAEPNRQPLQIPVMYAFREAFRARDSRKDGREYKDGERVLSERGRMRRRGANEEELKRNLGIDLLQLANTINLAAALDLEGLDYARRSVINYGVIDLSELSDFDRRLSDLPKRLKAALLNNEPRFIAETMEIKLGNKFDRVNQKLRMDIFAEMACRPVDIPMEFVAEIDVGSGRLRFDGVSTGR